MRISLFVSSWDCLRESLRRARTPCALGASVLAAAVLMSGCVALSTGYEAQTSVWPSDKAGEYIIAFSIYENLAAGGERLVSSPRIKVKDGSEGEVTLGDKHSSIKCSALVRSGDKGTTAAVRVRIEQGDKKVWTSRQTVMFTRDEPDRQSRDIPDSPDAVIKKE